MNQKVLKGGRGLAASCDPGFPKYPGIPGNLWESMGIPGNLGNSQGHLLESGIPPYLYYRTTVQ